MTDPSSAGRGLHPAARLFADECRRGQMDRREFLARATSLGVSGAAAFGLIGLAAPRAPAATPAPGGTLRIQQEVRPLKDPRTFDWSQIANQCRGLLEYLVRYRRDGTFSGMLLDRWEISEDATEYVLHVREGVRWNTGAEFTAEDVAHNIRRWCDKSEPTNSMAGRFATLVDPATGQARVGAIEVTGSHTVRLSLPAPDITLIAGMADYPAAIVDRTYAGGDPFAHGIGTGAYRPVSVEPGRICVLERHPDHEWWGSAVFGGPFAERIEFIDTGTDPRTALEAAQAGAFDMTYETTTAFLNAFDAIGWPHSGVQSADTAVIRCNQKAEVNGTTPYADARVRRALALAVDNAVCLELGYGDNGLIAANHHVCPLHPEYADIGPPPYDPAEALRLLDEAGMREFTHELVSIDDAWRRDTADAVAALLADAGIPVSRRNLPGDLYWKDWASFPFSITNWNMRPLGVQTLALAYRSGEAWNETGFAHAGFDAKLAEALTIADADARRRVMAEIEQILRDEGVIIQPYWRRLYRHIAPGVVGAEMHPTFEIHVHDIGFAG